MEPIVIVSAKRTPVGKMGKSLKNISAVQLGTIVTKAAIKSAGLSPKQIDQVIFGNVLQAGSGQNVSRQIEINSKIPSTKTAYTVNQVCGSGMKAIRAGEAAIEMGDAKIVVAGGTESMSNAPFLNYNIRNPHKFGNITLVDDLQKDALFDAFSNQPMGMTAENVANQFNISRKAQDKFALSSHRKAAFAQDHQYFDSEIVPVPIKQTNGKTHWFTKDECIRRDTNMNKLAKLKPVFKKGGSVTAGNSAGLNDGASALILMSKSTANKLGVKPLATIKNYAEAGIDPNIMGYAPYYAVKKLFKKENLTMNDIDLVELNEAFASQSIAVARALKIPSKKLNVNGGAIALGHPLGDSGSRIVATLIYNLKRTHQHNGLATLCIGGGMGMAMHIVC